MSNEGVEPGQVRAAVDHLDELSRAEYELSLAELLSDVSVVEADRMWRLGRLVGIAVKEPFAQPHPIGAGYSATGAQRAWELDLSSLDKPRDDLWQYELLRGLITDRDLQERVYIGPNPDGIARYVVSNRPSGTWKLPDDLEERLSTLLGIDPDSATFIAEHLGELTAEKVPTVDELADWIWMDLSPSMLLPLPIATALHAMNNERGIWRCMSISAAKYLCGDKKLRASIKKSAGSGQLANAAISPQALIGAISAESIDALDHTIPWLNPSGSIVAVGILIVIGNIGLDGYCDWVRSYVEPKSENPSIDS